MRCRVMRDRRGEVGDPEIPRMSRRWVVLGNAPHGVAWVAGEGCGISSRASHSAPDSSKTDDDRTCSVAALARLFCAGWMRHTACRDEIWDSLAFVLTSWCPARRFSQKKRKSGSKYL